MVSFFGGQQKEEPKNVIRPVLHSRIAGNFVPIVVRRSVEQWSCSQLMDLAPSHGIDVCSWRSWPREDGEEEQSPRRSLRFTDKPNLKQKLIGNSEQLAIKWQQRLPPLETGINYENSAGLKLKATFIDGCVVKTFPIGHL